MKKILILFLVLAAFISSCNKDTSTSGNTTYHKSGIIPVGSLRLFTSKGEITNRSAINLFDFNNKEDSALYSSAVTDLTTNKFMDKYTFLDADYAFVYMYYQDVKCTISHENGMLLLSSLDTSRIQSNDIVFSPGLYENIGEIKSNIFSSYLLSSTRGNYVFEHLFHQKYVFEKPPGRLFAPIIYFSIHKASYRWNTVDQLNNILNKDFYKNIPAGDTVTLREYKIEYEKE